MKKGFNLKIEGFKKHRGKELQFREIMPKRKDKKFDVTVLIIEK